MTEYEVGSQASPQAPASNVESGQEVETERGQEVDYNLPPSPPLNPANDEARLTLLQDLYPQLAQACVLSWSLGNMVGNMMRNAPIFGKLRNTKIQNSMRHAALELLLNPLYESTLSEKQALGKILGSATWAGNFALIGQCLSICSEMSVESLDLLANKTAEAVTDLKKVLSVFGEAIRGKVTPSGLRAVLAQTEIGAASTERLVHALEQIMEVINPQPMPRPAVLQAKLIHFANLFDERGLSSYADLCTDLVRQAQWLGKAVDLGYNLSHPFQYLSDKYDQVRMTKREQDAMRRQMAEIGLSEKVVKENAITPAVVRQWYSLRNEINSQVPGGATGKTDRLIAAIKELGYAPTPARAQRFLEEMLLPVAPRPQTRPRLDTSLSGRPGPLPQARPIAQPQQESQPSRQQIAARLRSLSKTADNGAPWTRQKWDEVVADIVAQGYAKEDAKRICAAIMWAEVGKGPWSGKKAFFKDALIALGEKLAQAKCANEAGEIDSFLAANG